MKEKLKNMNFAKFILWSFAIMDAGRAVNAAVTRNDYATAGIFIAIGVWLIYVAERVEGL